MICVRRLLFHAVLFALPLFFVCVLVVQFFMRFHVIHSTMGLRIFIRARYWAPDAASEYITRSASVFASFARNAIKRCIYHQPDRQLKSIAISSLSVSLSLSLPASLPSSLPFARFCRSRLPALTASVEKKMQIQCHCQCNSEHNKCKTRTKQQRPA